ncbi:MAG: hypothetical protein EOP07_10385 [Proteobacteria bacterium]|nr:MAG: hypothetical protein EOP07_10385 [Pseudomonadota bacterium]
MKNNLFVVMLLLVNACGTAKQNHEEVVQPQVTSAPELAVAPQPETVETENVSTTKDITVPEVKGVPTPSPEPTIKLIVIDPSAYEMGEGDVLLFQQKMIITKQSSTAMFPSAVELLCGDNVISSRPYHFILRGQPLEVSASLDMTKKDLDCREELSIRLLNRGNFVDMKETLLAVSRAQ